MARFAVALTSLKKPQIKPELSFALELVNERVAPRAKKHEIGEPLLSKSLARLVVQFEAIAFTADAPLRLP